MSLGILKFAGSVARGDDDYSRTFSRMIPLLFVCISNNNDKNTFIFLTLEDYISLLWLFRFGNY